jgi:hypothetical protein
MSFITRNVEEELFEDNDSLKDENLMLRRKIIDLEYELYKANYFIETKLTNLENKLKLLGVEI